MLTEKNVTSERPVASTSGRSSDGVPARSGTTVIIAHRVRGLQPAAVYEGNGRETERNSLCA